MRGTLIKHALIHLIVLLACPLYVPALNVLKVFFFVLLLKYHVSQIYVLPLLTSIDLTHHLMLCRGHTGRENSREQMRCIDVTTGTVLGEGAKFIHLRFLSAKVIRVEERTSLMFKQALA